MSALLTALAFCVCAFRSLCAKREQKIMVIKIIFNVSELNENIKLELFKNDIMKNYECKKFVCFHHFNTHTYTHKNISHFFVHILVWNAENMRTKKWEEYFNMKKRIKFYFLYIIWSGFNTAEKSWKGDARLYVFKPLCLCLCVKWL